MPSIFWTGKLSWPMKLVVNMNNIVAWILGNFSDPEAMKARVKKGYEGEVTEDVTRYDQKGIKHYTKIANELLGGIDLQGKEVLDVGCGTGILAHLALERGPAKIVCGDNSEYMLNQCRKKALDKRLSTPMDFRQLDAESLPFEDGSFDAIISGMMLGMLPNQGKAVKEMARVLRPGGALAISTQGKGYYWEASDAAFRKISKLYVFGYRIEFWPRSEPEMKKLFGEAGLKEIRTRRLTWQDTFKTGAETYDFFAATSSGWWFSKFPKEKIAPESQKIRDYFNSKGVNQITQDVIFAYGNKY